MTKAGDIAGDLAAWAVVLLLMLLAPDSWWSLLLIIPIAALGLTAMFVVGLLTDLLVMWWRR